MKEGACWEGGPPPQAGIQIVFKKVWLQFILWGRSLWLWARQAGSNWRGSRDQPAGNTLSGCRWSHRRVSVIHRKPIQGLLLKLTGMSAAGHHPSTLLATALGSNQKPCKSLGTKRPFAAPSADKIEHYAIFIRNTLSSWQWKMIWIWKRK